MAKLGTGEKDFQASLYANHLGAMEREKAERCMLMIRREQPFVINFLKLFIKKQCPLHEFL